MRAESFCDLANLGGWAGLSRFGDSHGFYQATVAIANYRHNGSL